MDGGSEFQGTVKELLETYGVKKVQISAYNLKSNNAIERGHQPLINALITLTKGGKRK